MSHTILIPQMNTQLVLLIENPLIGFGGILYELLIQATSSDSMYQTQPLDPSQRPVLETRTFHPFIKYGFESASIPNYDFTRSSILE